VMQSSIHFPPFRQGRSVRQTEAVGTGGAPPVSPRPGRAHQPRSSHTVPGAVPAPARFPRDCLHHGGAGAAPRGLPWDRGAASFLLRKGERLHRGSPTGRGDVDVPSLLTQGTGKRGRESPRTANPPVTRDTRRPRVGKHVRGEQG